MDTHQPSRSMRGVVETRVGMIVEWYVPIAMADGIVLRTDVFWPLAGAADRNAGCLSKAALTDIGQAEPAEDYRSRRQTSRFSDSGRRPGRPAGTTDWKRL